MFNPEVVVYILIILVALSIIFSIMYFLHVLNGLEQDLLVSREAVDVLSVSISNQDKTITRLWDKLENFESEQEDIDQILNTTSFEKYLLNKKIMDETFADKLKKEEE